MNYKAVAGQGLECKVDGKLVLVGNRKWMTSNFIEVTTEMNDKAAFLENQVRQYHIISLLIIIKGKNSHVCRYSK